MWLLVQMLRWGQVAAPVDVRAAARRVYRPDLFRQAARAVGMAAPDVDEKTEGTHADPWRLAGTPEAIEMGSDQFFDGGTFDPADVVAYLIRSPVRAPRVSLDALAAMNP
jgi:nitrate/nitrite transport system substrate-binding protein